MLTSSFPGAGLYDACLKNFTRVSDHVSLVQGFSHFRIDRGGLSEDINVAMVSWWLLIWLVTARMENEVAIDLITEHIKMKLRQPELQRLYHNLEVIPSNFQIRGMHTLIRDRTTSKADFVFYADRLLRLVRCFLLARITFELVHEMHHHICVVALTFSSAKCTAHSHRFRCLLANCRNLPRSYSHC